MKTAIWHRLLDLIAPRQCVVCGRRLSVSEQVLCLPCHRHLPYTRFQYSPYDNPMAQLFWKLQPVERVVAYFYYQPQSEAARLVYALKYGDRPDIGEHLGRLMAQELRLSDFFSGIDLLLPVPLAGKRQRQRGYNQSVELTRGIHAVTGIPMETRALRRTRFQQSQTRLTPDERRRNVSGVFALRRPERLEGRHVLLVDDICTTGATLNACADVFHHLPGVRISILTLGFTKV